MQNHSPCYYCGIRVNPFFAKEQQDAGFVCTQCSLLRNSGITVKETKVLAKVLLSLRHEDENRKIHGDSKISSNVVYFDVDDTLIKYFPKPNEKLITIDYGFIVETKSYATSIQVAEHKKHTELLKSLKQQGKTIVVWSAASGAWAKAVGDVLGLTPFVDIYLDKPEYYVDDLDATEWARNRVWLKDE